MNPSISLLDPVLYTAQKTYWRSPFLFTTSKRPSSDIYQSSPHDIAVIGVASRYFAERPELYRQAMNCARLAGGSTLIGGQKSVETVTAYLLLSLWPVPARKWEEDRGWVYLGLAIRYFVNICHLVTTNAAVVWQHRDGYQPAPPTHRQASERTARSRNAQ